MNDPSTGRYSLNNFSIDRPIMQNSQTNSRFHGSNSLYTPNLTESSKALYGSVQQIENSYGTDEGKQAVHKSRTITEPNGGLTIRCSAAIARYPAIRSLLGPSMIDSVDSSLGNKRHKLTLAKAMHIGA